MAAAGGVKGSNQSLIWSPTAQSTGSAGAPGESAPAGGAPQQTPQIFKDLFEDGNVSTDDIKKVKAEYEKVWMDPNNREAKEWGQGVTGAYPPTGVISGGYKSVMDHQWKKIEDWMKAHPDAKPEEVQAQVTERLEGAKLLLNQARSEARAFLDSAKASSDKVLEAMAAPKEW